MTKFLALGDTHGSISFFEKAVRWARAHDCEFILQVGDFGFIWLDQRGGGANDQRLSSLDRALKETGLTLKWLDGNHENFENMREQYGAHPDQPHAVQMTDYVTYLPRGYRFEVGGLKCMSFGGASSIDSDMRTKFVDWFPQELITDEQVARVADDPVDILFSHDCPIGGPVLDLFLAPGNWGLPERLEKRSRDNRIRLREVFNKVTPKLVVHGHYHKRYNDRINDSLIVGLGCNFDGTEAAYVVDTEGPIFDH